MKTIGMIVAVEMDAVLAKYGRAAGVEARGGFEGHRYEGGDFTLYIVSAGAGEIAAAAAAELLIAAYGAELIVNFGVVGGLTRPIPRRASPRRRNTSSGRGSFSRSCGRSSAPRRTSSSTARRTSAPCTSASAPTSAKWRPPASC